MTPQEKAQAQEAYNQRREKFAKVAAGWLTDIVNGLIELLIIEFAQNPTKTTAENYNSVFHAAKDRLEFDGPAMHKLMALAIKTGAKRLGLEGEILDEEIKTLISGVSNLNPFKKL